MVSKRSGELERFLTALGETPEVLRQLLKDVPANRVSWKPSRNEFSLLEHICHLRDIEIEGLAARLKRLQNEDNPNLPNIDGDRLAFERDYNRQDVDSAFVAFISARTSNIALLRFLPLEDFDRPGNLERVGPVTAWKLISLVVEHDAEHLRVIRELHSRILNQWS